MKASCECYVKSYAVVICLMKTKRGRGASVHLYVRACMGVCMNACVRQIQNVREECCSAAKLHRSALITSMSRQVYFKSYLFLSLWIFPQTVGGNISYLLTSVLYWQHPGKLFILHSIPCDWLFAPVGCDDWADMCCSLLRSTGMR